MKFKSAIITFIAIFLLFGCGDKDKNQGQNQTKDSNISQTNQPQKKQIYQDKITLKLLNGQDFALKMREDNGINKEVDDKKATLFVFFATWCPPCRAEIPHLNNLSEKFAKELNIVAILLENKGTDEISDFVKKNKIKYNVAVGDENFIFEKAVGGVIGLPASILYKANGSHAATYTGLVPEEMLEGDILKAVK
ncbi:thioredoxin [Campylobacter mucosalis]|uniref:Protein disulfide reductase, TlpA family n=1 Tax=Campylobacter mucosalis CCUG 21559 TaxID=1032067 RepID=A0A6G5QHV0_9BACT|nr:TlpA disulfide reductase family protein [Campylobacter mucosalis]KEA46419.1 thioredoxin [Campylobacter mucosalis]QCD45179.1 protein disulfide reductase, TlpA family [Campylobacter mucosalis CCUG 21559]QKF63094.1 protein disulfide reductase, TlpA family [Campylobacter mucosalis]